jgi:hypothetical protein
MCEEQEAIAKIYALDNRAIFLKVPKCKSDYDSFVRRVLLL